MWRIVEEINNVTGKSVWIIEKKSGVFFKKWSRDYKVGNSTIWSPLKSNSRSVAIERMNLLNEGKIIEKGEVIEI
jgi:hypothetical protein